MQEPDLLLCDEPTNHLDLETIQWLEGYLKKLDVPMVIVSHDREFLDRICNKIVETERGVATTFKGNYSEYVSAKQVKIEEKILAYEKQQKEIERLREMIRRLSAGSNSGRASQAQKELDKIIEVGRTDCKAIIWCHEQRTHSRKLAALHGNSRVVSLALRQQQQLGI